MNISRRFLLGSLAAMGAMPTFTAHAQNIGDKKFVFVILRGAMDGLAALIPQDSNVEALRQSVVPRPDERLSLGNSFALHPSLANLHAMYTSGEAAFVHAASTSIRSRSHFKAQDALEFLGDTYDDSGWLNRTINYLGGRGMSIGYSLPLAMSGTAQVANWAPPVFPDASDALMYRIEDLYANDMLFADAFADAESLNTTGVKLNQRGDAKKFDFQTQKLGAFMAADAGPNIGMVSLGGWDTHIGQANRLKRQFEKLDTGLATLKTSMGDSWDKTCVLVCSEFGRTARANGTNGTDHGTGGLVMLLGGSIKGGKVHGEWPELDSARLYKGRDLYPANSVESIVGGILRDHMGLSASSITNRILPGTQSIMSGLIA